MLQIVCPGCLANLRVPPQAAGKKVTCRKCGSSFLVASETAPVAPAEPAVLFPGDAPLPQMNLTAGSSEPPAIGPTEFAFSGAPATSLRPRRRGGPGFGTWLGVAVMLVIAGGGVWYWKFRETPPDGPLILKMPPQQIPELKPFRLRIANQRSGGLQNLQIEDGPPGGVVDPASGEFIWTPTEEQGPGEYTVKLTGLSARKPAQPVEITVLLTVDEKAEPPVFDQVEKKTVDAGTPVSCRIIARDTDVPAAKMEYQLVKSSAEVNAGLDAETGELTFTPTAEQAGAEISLIVQATEQDEFRKSSKLTVLFAVRKMESPIEKLMARLGADGQVDDPPYVDAIQFRGERHVLTFGVERLHVFLYDTPDAAAADEQDLMADSARPAAIADAFAATTGFYRAETYLAAYAGGDAAVSAKLESVFGKPFYESTYVPPTITPDRDVNLETLVQLYKERDPRTKTEKLFSPAEFPKIRHVFAERFEQSHEAEIRRAFGDGKEYDEMLEWLNDRIDFKESLYLAFDPQHDDIVSGLKLVKTLKEKFPKQIDAYLSLAVAVAVVWDNERGVYDYAHHQQRTKSLMPADLLGGVENFQYLVETEQMMEGRIRFVPWEFLVHVVNHRTPVAERQWVLTNMLPKRVMFGKCYSDVPYDTQMLNTESRVCRLGGQEYTLPNILRLGGVCAMQADYAARVGKSLGVPAAYVGGANRYGDLHAWVMWVELTAATPTNVSFRLQSHGRYGGDNYYIGTLADPQTGQGITDRDLERRLNAVGTDAFGKRHAELVMQAYPQLRDELQFDPETQFQFLSQVTRLNPWNEAAWLEVAKLAEDIGGDKRGRRLMQSVMAQLFKTFSQFPDFSLTVFPELVKFEPDIKTRIAYYYQLLDVYAAAKRPDLSFNALILLADLLVEQRRESEALQALAASVKKYATEGQYVPKMLDRIETLCDSPELKQALIAFYGEFLPLLPERRDDRPSVYCKQMYERGIKIFEQQGNSQLAQAYRQKLQALNAAGAP